MLINVKSRIHEFFSKECMLALDKIRRSKLERDNNEKVDKVVKVLNSFGIDYSPLGPGTNRYAILVDGYVMKIALDNEGVNDNYQEFALSHELQPYVIKVYECNGLMISTEYVTLISKEEFVESKNEIRRILSMLTETYLVGDVGTVTKNYLNWGYRDDGGLVILDYAYLFPASEELMRCEAMINKETGELCSGLLEYDENFHDMVCPACGAKQTTAKVRAKISQEERHRDRDLIRQNSFIATKPLTQVEVQFEDEEEDRYIPFDEIEEEVPMSNYNWDELDSDQRSQDEILFDQELALLIAEQGYSSNSNIEELVEEPEEIKINPHIFKIENEYADEDDEFDDEEKDSYVPFDEIEEDNGEADEIESDQSYREVLNELKAGALTQIKEDEREEALEIAKTQEELSMPDISHMVAEYENRKATIDVGDSPEEEVDEEEDVIPDVESETLADYETSDSALEAKTQVLSEDKQGVGPTANSVPEPALEIAEVESQEVHITSSPSVQGDGVGCEPYDIDKSFEIENVFDDTPENIGEVEARTEESVKEYLEEVEEKFEDLKEDLTNAKDALRQAAIDFLSGSEADEEEEPLDGDDSDMNIDVLRKALSIDADVDVDAENSYILELD